MWKQQSIFRYHLDKTIIKFTLEGSGLLRGNRSSLVKYGIGKLGIGMFCRHCFKPRPLIATFAITNNCPWACKYCSKAGRMHEKDMPIDIIKEVINYLRSIGTPIYALSGGEPLLKRDILEIVELIHHPYNVQIYTSGSGMNKEIADFLGKRGNVSIYISILSSNPKTNDSFRGKPGAYRVAMRAIDILKESGVHVGVATIASKSLLKDGIIQFLIELKKLGVGQVLIFEPKVTGSALDCHDWMLSKKEIDYVASLHNLQKTRSDVPTVFSFPYVEGKNVLGCSAGYCRVHIDGSGNVCPCDFVPLSFGNIYEEPFPEIWERMHTYFPSPRNTCFINTYYKEIQRSSQGKLPLPPEKSIELCKRFPPTNAYPRLYDTLGFNPDLPILSDLGII